jgi:hypothetical protein
MTPQKSSYSSVSVGDGFRFGVGFTLGSLVASLVIVPVFACIGFVAMSLLGGSLAALLNNIP